MNPLDFVIPNKIRWWLKERPQMPDDLGFIPSVSGGHDSKPQFLQGSLAPLCCEGINWDIPREALSLASTFY